MNRLLKFTLIITIIWLAFTGTGCVGKANGAVASGKVTDYRAAEPAALEKDKPAPDFQFTRSNGETILLSQLTGIVVLLNFWAVDCPYCVREMPLFEQVYQQMGDTRLVVLAINTGESETKVTQFLAQRTLNYDIILDPVLYVSTLYEARYLPTTYIIDKAGNVVAGKIGAFSNAAEITAAIAPYLD